MLSLLLLRKGQGRAASAHKPPPMHARTQAPSDEQQVRLVASSSELIRAA